MESDNRNDHRIGQDPSKYCESTPRSQVNLSHDSSRARRAVGRACELPLGSATEAQKAPEQGLELSAM